MITMRPRYLLTALLAVGVICSAAVFGGRQPAPQAVHSLHTIRASRGPLPVGHVQVGVERVSGYSYSPNPPDGAILNTIIGTTIVLPPPSRGQWGEAKVTGGSGSLASPLSQWSGPSEDLAVGSAGIGVAVNGAGTVEITVPDIGNEAGSWHGTVVASGVYPPCSGTAC